MKIFDYLEKYDYEQLVFCHDGETGLKAIICIHDTTLISPRGTENLELPVPKKMRFLMF